MFMRRPVLAASPEVAAFEAQVGKTRCSNVRFDLRRRRLQAIFVGAGGQRFSYLDLGDTVVAESDREALEYFKVQLEENGEYWRRFGCQPEWQGKHVLEVGCGHGAMSVQVAQAGGVVLGIDLDEQHIDFANRNLSERFPELVDRVTFRAVDALNLPTDERFDVILSKDTFEHVANVDSLMQGLGKRLVPGGRLYVGFSPLYHSPWGDHSRSGLRLPWAHAILPRSVVYAAASRHGGCRVTSLADVGLNGNTPQQFRDAFDNSGLQLLSIAYNRGDKRLLPLFERVGRRYPRLEKYTTVSIYATFAA
jgi:SAM-dependent methyltransferase